MQSGRGLQTGRHPRGAVTARREAPSRHTAAVRRVRRWEVAGSGHGACGKEQGAAKVLPGRLLQACARRGSLPRAGAATKAGWAVGAHLLEHVESLTTDLSVRVCGAQAGAGGGGAESARGTRAARASSNRRWRAPLQAKPPARPAPAAPGAASRPLRRRARASLTKSTALGLLGPPRQHALDDVRPVDLRVRGLAALAGVRAGARSEAGVALGRRRHAQVEARVGRARVADGAVSLQLVKVTLGGQA